MTKTKEERRAYAKAYYAANKEKFAGYNHAYHEAHKEDRLKYHAEYHAQNRIVQNAKRLKYHEDHKAADNATARAYRAANPERIKKLGEEYRAAHRKEASENSKAWRNATRAAVQKYLGGQCACCGERESEMLTLDHVQNDGGGASGKRRHHHHDYMEVKRAFESGNNVEIDRVKGKYALLCWKCNVSKKNGGVCRHNRAPLSGEGVKECTRAMREYSRKVRTLLGGKCVCCGEAELEFLAVDHIQNDGKHAKKNKNGTRNAYSYYSEIVNGFKVGNDSAVKMRFQLMCHSCNESKHQGHGLCVHQRKIAKSVCVAL